MNINKFKEIMQHLDTECFGESPISMFNTNVVEQKPNIFSCIFDGYIHIVFRFNSDGSVDRVTDIALKDFKTDEDFANLFSGSVEPVDHFNTVDEMIESIISYMKVV